MPVAAAILAALSLAAGGRSQDLAIVGVRAHPVAGAGIENATILCQGGTIAAIGPGLTVPRGCRVLEGRGLEAWPGFIDGWTTLGLTEIASVAGSVDTTEIGDWNAHLRAAAAVDPASEHIPVARANGITTALVVPGGGHFPGSPFVASLFGRTVDAMAVAPAAPLMMLRIPEPPGRDWTKTDEAERDREVEKGWKPLEDHLLRARRIARLEEEGLDPIPDPATGQERLSLLALARHLRAKGRFVVRADGRDHLLACLRFARKHELLLILAGLRDAWQVAPELAASPHRFLLGPPWTVPGRDEPYDAHFATAAVLARAGVRFGMLSGSSANVRNLPYQAATMVAHGLAREAALRALTLGGAEALGIEGTRGSLEPGKQADIVLWNGDPLDARSGPAHVVLDGREVPPGDRHRRLAEPHIPR